ncbi:hypothetical protein GGI22_005413, partial [Coemansia erecta]
MMDRSDFLGIMEIIDKRMNDKGKLWRHVFKALVVLRHLLVYGSPYVVQYAIDNLYIVRTLREFQHIDDSGRDQGTNVRDKAKELTALLSDRSKIDEMRKRGGDGGGRGNMGGYGDSMGGYNRGYASSSSRIPYGGSSSSRVERRGGHGRSGSLANSSNRYGDDDSEMRRAIAESKRSETSKKVPKDYDEDAALRKAIEASAREAREKEEKQRSQKDTTVLKSAAPAPAGELDLLGSFDDDFDAGASNVNNIGMMSASTNSFSQQPQQQMGTGLAGNNMMSAFGGNQMGGVGMNQMGSGNANFDPFGLNNTGDSNGFNAFGAGGGMGMGVGMTGSNYNTNMFDTSSAFNPNGSQLVSQKFMSTTTITETSGAQNPFGQTTTMPSASTNNLFDTGMSGTPSGFGGSASNLGGASGAFGSAFDGGMAAKALPY